MIPHNHLSLYNFFMRITQFLKRTLQHLEDNNNTQMAAALSYFSLFAIAPVLIILVTFLEIFLSNTQTQQAILIEVMRLFPPTIAEVIHDVINNITTYAPPNNLTGIISIILLVFSSTTLIRELQRMINTLWEIKPTQITVSQRFRKRVVAFVSLILLGVLLLASFILNTALSSFGEYIALYIGFDPFTLFALNILVSFTTVSTLFALLFRYLPDATLTWRDIMFGSIITGILFILGKNIISYILAHAPYGTLFGAAGTILLFLLWVYYSSHIFLFGVALTYMYAKHHGSGVTVKN